MDSARLFVSDETREGMPTFLQKCPPNWTSTPVDEANRRGKSGPSGPYDATAAKVAV